MQKVFLCLLSIALISAGCLKKDAGCSYKASNAVASTSEQQDIATYLSNNGITTAVKYNNGMYYEIISAGNSVTPNLCSQVTVNYTGKLTNGSTFDAQSGIVLTLGALIEGWKTGLPLIQKGGHIKLYIPPTLGYGNVDVKDGSTIIIPANSIIIFDISLTEIN